MGRALLIQEDLERGHRLESAGKKASPLRSGRGKAFMVLGLEGRGARVRSWSFLKYELKDQFVVVVLSCR